jgi:hypothetical protein
MTPAVHHIEGCEQRGGAVPDVVVSHGATTTLLQWQTRLGSIERLDLALLVDGEHDGMRRGVDVEPDDLSQLGGELRIVGQLGQTRPMRLQTVAAPDALHRADTDALNLGHGGSGPMRCLTRRIGLGRRDHVRHSSGFEARDARRTCLVAQQARDTVGHEAFLPAPHSRFADTRSAHDLSRAAAVRRQQHDLCSPDVLLRSVSVRHDSAQPDTVLGTHCNFDAGAHPADSHFGDAQGILNRTQTSDSIH